MKPLRLLSAIVAVVLGTACPKSSGDTPPAPTPAAVAAPQPPPPVAVGPSGPDGKLTWKDIQPLFADGCDHCHGANPRPGNWVAKAKHHLDTSTYPFGGADGADSLDEIIEVLQLDPMGRRKMPMDEKTEYPEEKAQKIVKWVMDGALDANGKPPVWPPQASSGQNH
jgi:hypothetical protein